MRIIQINGTYGNSDSVGRTTKEMHEYFVGNNIDSFCYVCSFNDDSTASDTVKVFGSKISRYMHGLLSRITGLQGYFSCLQTRKLTKMIGEKNPDVVILRVLHNNSVNLNLLTKYLAEKNIITIIVLHDTWYITGHCCGWEKYKCSKWMESCGNCPGMKDDNKSYLFDTSAKVLKDKKMWFNRIKNLYVVGVSGFMESSAKHSIVKDAYSISGIYNWIDLERFKPLPYMKLRKKNGFRDTDKIVIGVASYWSEEKGILIFIRLAQQMKDVKFVLIGDYDKNKYIYPSNIMFKGMIKDLNVLAELYSQSNVLLNLSEYDSFGKVTAEAISCGIPAIAYNRSGAVELIRNERGKLCEYGDFDSIKESLDAILHTDKVSWIEPLRNYAEENFDKEKNIKKYLALIHH